MGCLDVENDECLPAIVAPAQTELMEGYGFYIDAQGVPLSIDAFALEDARERES